MESNFNYNFTDMYLEEHVEGLKEFFPEPQYSLEIIKEDPLVGVTQYKLKVSELLQKTYEFDDYDLREVYWLFERRYPREGLANIAEAMKKRITESRLSN